MTRFKKPKFAKGDTLKTPDGEGIVDRLALDQGKTWYFINGRPYAHTEVTLINKAKNPQKGHENDGLPF